MFRLLDTDMRSSVMCFVLLVCGSAPLAACNASHDLSADASAVARLDGGSVSQPGSSPDTAAPDGDQPVPRDGSVTEHDAALGEADAGHWEVDAGALPPTARTCDAVADGGTESRVRYASASVARGSECVAETQRRTCRDGSWSGWSGSFTFESCVVQQAASCDGIPDGGQQVRVRYEHTTAPYGGSCTSEAQTRICSNGAWSAWSGSFSVESCTVQGAASCDGTPSGGQQARVRYESTMAPYGASCMGETQSRVCTNGLWSAWSGTFAAESCFVQPPASCDGVASGETQARVRFEYATVPYGGTCTSERQTRTCVDGSWGAWSGSYELESCTVQAAASCGDAPSGSREDRVRYESATVPYGSHCVSETQSRTCYDGAWGAFSGTFAEVSCTVQAPKSCDGTPHGKSETRTRYEHPFVLSGESCASEAQQRTCDDGTWSAWTPSTSFGYDSCTEDTASECLPWRAERCGFHSRCVPQDDHYVCECDAGFTRVDTTDPHRYACSRHADQLALSFHNFARGWSQIVSDGDGNFFVGSNLGERAYPGFGEGPVVAKFAPDGTRLWMQQPVTAWTLAVDPNGHLIIAGYLGGTQLMLIELDENGLELWHASYDYSWNGSYDSTFVTVDAAGQLYLVGTLGRGAQLTLGDLTVVVDATATHYVAAIERGGEVAWARQFVVNQTSANVSDNDLSSVAAGVDAVHVFGGMQGTLDLDGQGTLHSDARAGVWLSISGAGEIRTAEVHARGMGSATASFDGQLIYAQPDGLVTRLVGPAGFTPSAAAVALGAASETGSLFGIQRPYADLGEGTVRGWGIAHIAATGALDWGHYVLTDQVVGIAAAAGGGAYVLRTSSADGFQEYTVDVLPAQ